jgi:hypothetical protein
VDDRGLRQAVEDLALGQRQGAAAEDTLHGIELVDAQPPDQRAERGRLDQQREQDEARRQHRDQVPDIGRHARVLADRQRQGQGDRAAHAAPQDDQLVADADRPLAQQQAHGRQDAEQGEGARRERAQEQGREQEEIARLRLPDRVGHQHGGQDEDQGTRPEAELAPDGADALPFPGADPHPGEGAEDEARDHHGDDPRDVEVGLAQGVGEVGQGEAQRDLGGAALADAGDDEGRDPSQHEADQGAARELPCQIRCHLRDDRDLVGARAAADDREEGGGQGDRRRVVEQALALDQEGEPATRANLAEDRGDGAGIGGGDDRRDQEAGGERERRHRPHGEPGHGGGDQDSEHGEDQDRAEIVQELAAVELGRRVEQQDRQEHPEQDVGRDLELAQLVEEVADDGAGDGGRQRVGQPDAEAQGAAEAGQQDGVGQPQAGGEVGQEGDQGEQPGDAENEPTRACHAHDSLRRLRHPPATLA